MGQGMDVCLAEPAEAGTLEEGLESEFVGCLVRQAGLVFLGAKPASVFGFMSRLAEAERSPSRARRIVGELLRTYASGLSSSGVRATGLGWRDGRLMLLVWRPDLVRAALSDEGARALLLRSGIRPDPDEALRCLVGRLRSYYAGRASFPHEVGLVLGYPVEDVEGFIADGGRGAVACGRWKVYGDPLAARRRFEELGRRERDARRLYAEGVPVRELLRMGSAPAEPGATDDGRRTWARA